MLNIICWHNYSTLDERAFLSDLDIQNWNASGHHDTNLMIFSCDLKVVLNIMFPRKSWTVDILYYRIIALLRAGCRSSDRRRLNEYKEIENTPTLYTYMPEEGYFFIFFRRGIHDQRKVRDYRKSYFTVIVCFVFCIQ